MEQYSITDLCRYNLFLKGQFPRYSIARYNKIFSILIRIGHHIVNCIRNKKRVQTGDFNVLRGLLYNYVEGVYTDGQLHHDLLKILIQDVKFVSEKKELLKRKILESILIIHTFLKHNTYQLYNIESVNYFITKTITIYSLYIAILGGE